MPIDADRCAHLYSTIARSFSQELMDIFRIENSVADLDEKVEKRSVASLEPLSIPL